ncbi:hypothetical protein POQMFEI_00071 [Enterococcus phage vB_OCPT_CCS2]|nr:hypothetical protein POQMFEI_00071 [Enterococcus phage vB_OCPT_CCS2]
MKNIKLNSNVVRASVEDWMSNELVFFEGSNCVTEAIEWKEEQSINYASNDNGRVIIFGSEEFEERYNEQSEDLYIIGYNKDGQQVAVEFG